MGILDFLIGNGDLRDRQEYDYYNGTATPVTDPEKQGRRAQSELDRVRGVPESRRNFGTFGMHNVDAEHISAERMSKLKAKYGDE